ncbi:MAG: hypothetical protein JXN59_01785 [Anaerolineae bacterium]|nr:hypothetical protein [Anaerolineae bacterium]
MTLLDVITALFSGSTSALEAIFASPNGRLIALQIVVLAGISESLGNSVILFANRVSPRRYVFSLLLSVVIYVGGFFVWVLSIDIVARLMFDRAGDLEQIAAAVSLSYIPLLLGFLTLLPYLGNPILKVLYLITFFVLIGALEVALDLTEWEAVLCSQFGALFNLLLRATVGRPIIWLETRLRSWVAGRPLQFNLKDLFEQAREDLLDSLTDREDRP